MVKKIKDKYIIVGDDEIVKTYSDFKSAKWDVSFFRLMYHEVKIYQLVVENDEPVK